MRIALIAASTILLASGIAARGQDITGGSSPMSNQCWDVSSNAVKNQAPGAAVSGSSGTVGSAGTSTPGTRDTVAELGGAVGATIVRLA